MGVDLLELPETPAARDALAFLDVSAPAVVKNHSLRTFLLGRAYARRHAIDVDEEGLLLAAAFHDLGLVAPLRRSEDVAFTVLGARELRRFLDARGVPAERRDALATAIELHLRLLPPWKQGPVAGLLQVGAWMDVTRLRRWSLRKDARAIETAHPRLGLDLSFPGLLLGSIAGPRACLGMLFPGGFRG